MLVSCTRDMDILPMLSYPGCHVRAKYIGCMRTHAHGRQVTSLLCQSDIIITCCISTYSGISESLFLRIKLRDNCIQNFHLGRYIIGYTVGNLVLRQSVS